MPALRALPILVAMLVFLAGGAAAVTAQAAAEPAKAPPPTDKPAAIPAITFYLARGEANACGHGCSEWIAAEGKIDPGAAQRLRRLLAKLGHRRPPIYFHSPGGAVIGAIELGRLIRERKLQVSVAHTVPLGCDRDKPLEKSCEALKRSGQELKAELDPALTMCNSSCVYALAGGAVRLVPPGTKLAIHDVGFEPSVKLPRGILLTEAKQMIHRRLQDYLREMGMDKALFAATLSVPFESMKPLDRDDLVRFGIDQREFGETAWWFVSKPRPAMGKTFFLHTDGPLRHLNGLVTLDCAPGRDVRLAFARDHADAWADATRPVSINIDEQRIDLPYQMRLRDFQARSARLPANRLDALGEDAKVRIPGSYFGRNDGSADSVTLSMDRFAAVYAKLRKSCDEAAPNVAAAAPAVKTVPVPFIAGRPIPTQKIVSPRAADAKSTGAADAPAATPKDAAESTVTKEKSEQSAANAAGSPAQPEAIQESCRLQIADAPRHVTGRVTDYVPDEQAVALTRRVEAELGAKISPAYLSLKRVKVEGNPKTGYWVTMAAIPEDLSVKVGDVVELNGRYRDPKLPCHFIPWTINRLVNRAG